MTRLKPLKNVPLLQDDAYKVIMSYYDSGEYAKENFNDFYIHGLSDDTYKLNMPLPPHRQANHSIVMVTGGFITASSGIDNYTIGKNSLIGVPAGQITSLSFMSDDAEGFYLHFASDYLSHTKNDLSDWLIQPYIKYQHHDADHLKMLINPIKNLHESEKNTNIIKLYLQTFLAEMKQSLNFKLRINFLANERITLEFKRLLGDHVTNAKSVGFYAAELNVTPNHLNKSVKATLGRSASALIDETLILESKVLMRQSNVAVGEIAFEIGFEDVSYFGRFFKKHTGLTPTEYRKMIELSE
jgi:AraC family transcriptional activator of pobA